MNCMTPSKGSSKKCWAQRWGPREGPTRAQGKGPTRAPGRSPTRASGKGPQGQGKGPQVPKGQTMALGKGPIS